MDSKYNDIDDEFVVEYLKSLVNKVYKLLPMKEESNPTLDKYHESLMFELTGFGNLFKSFVNNANFISLLASLESLLLIEDMTLYKRKVFDSISLVKKMK